MKAAIIVVVLGLAGFLVWQKLYSPAARTERAYQACLKEAEAAGGRIKADPAAKAPPGNAGDSATAMADAMRAPIDAMVQGLSGAMCGAMRAACQSDFNGGACQGALARYK